jgi:Tfp pilus assembly pilus retraction ATPase PilT
VAAMIEAINQQLSVNVTTIEDPVEFKFKNKTAFIRQIDLQKHTTSCAAALRNVLRQDPDIIVIQEIRDDETAQLALSLAQTNHLVIATLHGLTDSPSALLRFIAMTGNKFAAAATHTQAVIAQQLLAPKDRRSKRVLIQEVMRPRQNPEIKKLLRDRSTEVEAYDDAVGKFNSVTNLEVRYVTSLFQALKNNEIAAAKAFAATRHEEELLELYRTVRLEAGSTVGMPSFLMKRDGTGNTVKPLES